MRTIKFYTLGCKVNQYETQSIRERFLGAGFQESSNGRPADVCLINTCTVTHKADRDSRHAILKARSLAPRAKIIVTGCLTELDEDKIKDAYDKAIIVKNKEKENILNVFFSQDSRTLELKNSRTESGISYFQGHTRAFLKIQDGCDNFCSYCKVPLVRGRSRSRDLSEIICEAKALAKNGFTPLETKGKQEKDKMSLTGFKEIVLCGICLGSYGKDLSSPLSLVDVIENLEKIRGLLRIRLSSIEAGDVTDELIAKMGKSKKLCRHLHIPIQSGDDRILKKMNRRYTRGDYLKLARRIKRQVPGIAITTDVLVGFPGESDAAFGNTLNLVKKILPLRAHIFPYSPREGTLAADFNHKLNPDILKRRMKRLRDLAGSCSLKYRRQFLHKKMGVLVESRSKENPDFWEGHSDNYIKVLVKAKRNLKNKLIPVKLKKISGDSVLADIC